MDNGKTSDFCWNSPMEQVDNTVMFFLLSNHKTNIFIKNQGIVEKFSMDHNAPVSGKVLDVWQCNKAIYSIVKFNLSGNKRQLQLIKTYFVKKTQKDYSYNNKNTKTAIAKKGKNKSKSGIESTISKTKTKEMRWDYKPMQKVLLKLVMYESSSDIDININISKSKNNNKRNVGSSNRSRSNMCTSRNCDAPNIFKNCNYFDSKCQTLFSVENDNKQKQGIIIRLISKYKPAPTKKNVQNKRYNYNKSKSKSKLKLKESKTKSAKSPKISNIDHDRSKHNSHEMKAGETMIDQIKPQSIFLDLLFNQSKCHFVFYHKKSKTLILMLKLDCKAVNCNEDESKENENTNNNYGGINTADGYWKWRENAIKDNNGRLLVQLKINFKKKKLISSRIANIIINENKCRIVAYDETRAMIVYDTLPDIKAQYQPLRNIHEKIQNTDAEAGESYTYMGEYHEVRLWLKSQTDVWYHNRPEARIHNYKMMRLNDLVDRWIDLQI